MSALGRYSGLCWYVAALILVVSSVQDGVRTIRDETVSPLDGTECPGAVLDGMSGRLPKTRKIGQ